jgi:hypothetical protein
MGTSSQSPRARRDSTDNSEKYAKGSVPASWARDTGKAPAPENEGAYKLFDKEGNVKQDRGGDTVRGV